MSSKKQITIPILFCLLVVLATFLYFYLKGSGHNFIAKSVISEQEVTDCGCGVCGGNETETKVVELQGEAGKVKLEEIKRQIKARRENPNSCAVQGCNSSCTLYKLV